MRSLVVYESMWGNTEQVARAVARGLAVDGTVDVLDVSGEVPHELDGIDLLVVGGPTHAFSMSRPSTRADAVTKGAPRGHEQQGIREWLDALRRSGHRCYAGVFDTKMNRRWLPGSAARGAARLLARRNVDLALEPTSFYVTGASGPLVEGEIDRAKDWGARLARSVPTGT